MKPFIQFLNESLYPHKRDKGHGGVHQKHMKSRHPDYKGHMFEFDDANKGNL